MGWKRWRRWWRRAAMAAAVVLSAVVLPAGASLGAQEPARRGAAAEITPAADEAIGKGLAYLAARQRRDGSLGSGEHARSTAVTALSGLAFISSGSTPGRGPHGEHTSRCVEFLLANTEPSGFIHVPASGGHGPMYGHGFATLFLAEAYGMAPQAQLREKLSRAVRLIVTTQNHEGGWRYQPRRADADISVTICQVMALRAARNAGLAVPKETIDRAVAYVKQSQNPDGGFMYMLSGGPSAFPRSAAAVVTLFNAGIYEGPEIDRGLAYLMRFLPKSAPGREAYYYYAQYYAAQAMWQAGGGHWERWFPAMRDELIDRQRGDGAWPAPQVCPEYGTAMALIVLQVPNQYLPILQR